MIRDPMGRKKGTEGLFHFTNKLMKPGAGFVFAFQFPLDWSRLWMILGSLDSPKCSLLASP